MKYINADILREKLIERLGLFEGLSSDTISPIRIDECKKIIGIIDSLQQEQQEVDLEKEIRRFLTNATKMGNGEWRGKYAINDIGFRAVASHFYELGQKDAANKYDEIEYNRQKVEEEMLDKSLEEAAEEYEDWAESYSQSDFPTCISFRQAFKAGAKWMAGQGSTKDGEVTDDNDFIKFNDGTYIDLRPDLASKSFDLKTGDRVIVQVRKKEESK